MNLETKARVQGEQMDTGLGTPEGRQSRRELEAEARSTECSFLESGKTQRCVLMEHKESVKRYLSQSRWRPRGQL